jgi:Flp pilus assembly protein protease CpaA
MSAIFTLGVFLRLGPRPRTWSLIPVLLALSLIVVTDLRLRLIPDKITVPSIIYVLILALVSGLPAFGRALLGAAIAGLAILVLAVLSRGGIGGGDLKLMVLIGAALGWQSALTVFVLSQVLALAVAVVLSIVRRRVFQGWLPVGALIAALGAIALVTNPI